MQLVAADLEQIFRECFFAEYATIPVGGAPEPLYVPSPEVLRKPHRVVYREDYFASALHEVVHWWIAGAERRKLEDYGDWYRPDGRDPREQAEFERAERFLAALRRARGTP